MSDWQTGEWLWAALAAACFVSGVALYIWEFSRGWTPIRIFREYRYEYRLSKVENRPRHTSYEWGARLGLANALWFVAAIAVFNILRWSIALPPWQ
jgi:hypothetical protein